MTRRWTHLAATLSAPSPFDRSLQPDRIEQVELHGAEGKWAVVHLFQPHGASLLFLGPETRLALHTWPEHGLATLDLHLAAPKEEAERLCRSLERALGWARSDCHVFQREGERT